MTWFNYNWQIIIIIFTDFFITLFTFLNIFFFLQFYKIVSILQKLISNTSPLHGFKQDVWWKWPLYLYTVATSNTESVISRMQQRYTKNGCHKKTGKWTYFRHITQWWLSFWTVSSTLSFIVNSVFVNTLWMVQWHAHICWKTTLIQLLCLSMNKTDLISSSWMMV